MGMGVKSRRLGTLPLMLMLKKNRVIRDETTGKSKMR